MKQKPELLEFEQNIIDAFKKVGYSKLTKIQEKAVPVLARRINALLVAPTGSGKTESAVIPIFTMLAESKAKGIRAIYLTPLRALNRDVLRRIIVYAESYGLRVAVRHGDTSQKERREIASRPPDILITTPETLAILLVNEKMREHLRSLEWIVIDEMHELIPNERGTHLSLSLERLQDIASKELVRIGLSATIGNIKDAARFMVGIDRKCAILIDNSIRKYDIDIVHQEGSLNSVARYILDYVKKNNANNLLLFTNTRDEAEYLATVMKSYNDVNIDIHHGSLSKDVREETERKLREGNAGIVVCTSSLELGLDIGSVETVVHYGSPRQVSKLAQRIGRSRHKIGYSAKGLIVTNNDDDELEALAIIERMNKGSIENYRIHESSLDVLAHHLVGLALQYDSVKIEDAMKIVTRAYPFRNVTVADIDSCLEILARSYIVRYEGNEYKRRAKARKYYFENISTIPDILKFEVTDAVSNRIIGTLDQEFVGDYGEKGNVFVLKGSQWRVLAVDDSKLKVTVEPIRGSAVNVPYWVGEMIPVDYETAKVVGKLRINFVKDNSIVRSYNTLKHIPDDNTIVVESSIAKNTVVIHSCMGTKVNNTLASLFSTIISSKTGYTVEARADAYRIVLTSNARIAEKHVRDCLQDEYDLETVVVASLTNTHNLDWCIWCVAKRFGLVERSAVYDRKAARLIHDRYAKTAVVKEAIRELLHNKYDVEKTEEIFERIRRKEIRFIWIEIDEFSDLAKPILEHADRFSAMPLSVEQGVLELVKERLERTKHRLICIRCGKWEHVIETSAIPDNLRCTLCNSKLITSTYVSDYELMGIIQKKLKGVKLKDDEEHRFMRAWKLASLIHNFGRKALLVLSGYGIGVDTAARILRNCVDDSNIYRMIYDAERQYITTRGFWDD